MKAIPCFLYIFPDDVDAKTAYPSLAKEKLEMKSISACYRHVRNHNIKQFVIWEAKARN